MTMNLKDLNEIINFNDLNWIEKEGKFCLLSENDIDLIVRSCLESDITEIDDVEKVVRFAEDKIAGKLLVDAILNDKVNIIINGEEIHFTSKEQ